MKTNPSRKQLIGTTSWLMPGTYYQNAKLVAQQVDFVELLVYTWDQQTCDLMNSEISKLGSLSEKHGLFYTVHLPTDSIQNVVCAYEYFERSSLQIINYVLHPLNGIERFLFQNGSRVSVENLREKIVYHQNMTFDIGHHLLGERFDCKYTKNVNELHLMGVHDQRDHLRIDKETMQQVLEIFREELRRIPLLCVEVFDIQDLFESLKVLKAFLG